jgi:hypothetical protein
MAMVVLVVLWIVVMFAGTRWLAARTSRLRAMEGINGGPEPRAGDLSIPDPTLGDVVIPDTVPSEWVDAYRNE